MLTRRDFIHLAGGAAASMALPGCAASPPLRKEVFPDFGDSARPYLGLATSLREEYDYEARVEGRLPGGPAGGSSQRWTCRDRLPESPRPLQLSRLVER